MPAFGPIMDGMKHSSIATVLTIGTALTLAACAPSNGTGNSSASSSSSSSVAQSSSVSSGYANMIQVTSPTPNMAISKSKPLVITGKAVGPWYFEASFPVKLLDSAGNVLAQGPAQAQGDWMVVTFVPFQATLNFTTTATSGTLVLQNDNPSGLPENAKSISIPVTFIP